MDFALKAVDLALSRGLSVTITKDGSMVLGSGTSTVAGPVPQYVSDTVNDLPRGAVAKTVRAKFKKLGSTGTVMAHNENTIRAAFNAEGWGATVKSTETPNEYFCIRTRITRRARSI
jgi:ABC-type proline/glycine betaine transport system ATPase subunit